MDVNKYLIIIKNNDRTEDVISYENNKNLINVKYKSSEKMYSYSRRDFQFYKNPTEISIKDQKVILNQGYVYNVAKILKFESIYKLFLGDGTNIIVSECNLELVSDSCLFVFITSCIIPLSVFLSAFKSFISLLRSSTTLSLYSLISLILTSVSDLFSLSFLSTCLYRNTMQPPNIVIAQTNNPANVDILNDSVIACSKIIPPLSIYI